MLKVGEPNSSEFKQKGTSIIKVWSNLQNLIRNVAELAHGPNVSSTDNFSQLLSAYSHHSPSSLQMTCAQEGVKAANSPQL